ncbi:MAG: hypothetical protein R2795_03765 [Saprospiraceae bacterium]
MLSQPVYDMGIVNAGMIEVYEEIPADLLVHVEDVLLNRRPDATERLTEFAESVKTREDANSKRHGLAGRYPARTPDARFGKGIPPTTFLKILKKRGCSTSGLCGH